MRLTRDEILLIALILGALALGAATKHYRDAHRAPLPPPVKALPADSSE
jgi:hypothetical protein